MIRRVGSMVSRKRFGREARAEGVRETTERFPPEVRWSDTIDPMRLCYSITKSS